MEHFRTAIRSGKARREAKENAKSHSLNTTTLPASRKKHGKNYEKFYKTATSQKCPSWGASRCLVALQVREAQHHHTRLPGAKVAPSPAKSMNGTWRKCHTVIHLLTYLLNLFKLILLQFTTQCRNALLLCRVFLYVYFCCFLFSTVEMSKAHSLEMKKWNGTIDPRHTEIMPVTIWLMTPMIFQDAFPFSVKLSQLTTTLMKRH